MSVTSDLVHYVDWASQPDLHKCCEGKYGEGAPYIREHWSVPAWGVNQDDYPADVYFADDGWLYTFERELVTCNQCLAHI